MLVIGRALKHLRAAALDDVVGQQNGRAASPWSSTLPIVISPRSVCRSPEIAFRCGLAAPLAPRRW